ncbi:MAG: hypothetical protein FWD52_08425 [Candidatus Bathyarchaeota archaeon]|nr:hypothetical protein [Candidatus Termiticorpusculum sp.]
MTKVCQIWNQKLPIKKLFISILSTFIILICLLTLAFLSQQQFNNDGSSEPVYLGISFCGNTTAEAKLLIDKVKDYTNLFVLQSGPVSHNLTATTEICDYATSQGLDIIVYFGWFDPEHSWRYPWIQNATQRYGEKFLGVYYYDEPGGLQLDYDWETLFINWNSHIKEQGTNADPFYQKLLDSSEGYLNGTLRDYDIEAQIYTQHLQNDPDLSLLRNSSIQTFVSDYALYWWDYLGGYDVVFAQLGWNNWNNSVTQEIDLIKGAAHLQDKDWGVIATWKYPNAPYLDTGDEIYNQLLLAYRAGAKYLVIFDYPSIEGNPYGVLTADHFEALQKLWIDINNPTIKRVTKPEAVLVLPQNYGWGMRHVDDRIWLWSADEHSPQIWNITQKLVKQYGINLDIVYDDPQFPVTGKYNKIYYWNQTLT